MVLINFLFDPWPWYVSGPILGLFVPILLLVGNKQLGISSSFCHVYSALGIKKIKLFNYDWRQHQWSLAFVLGILISGIIYSFFDFKIGDLSAKSTLYFSSKNIEIKEFFPSSIITSNLNFRGLLLMIFGGFFIGFGSRYANGCTAGHAIMGLSLLSKGSLVAVTGFFIGGLLGTFLILDNVL